MNLYNTFKKYYIDGMDEYINFCRDNSVQSDYEEVHHIFPTFIDSKFKNLKEYPENAAYLSIGNHIKAHILLYKSIKRNSNNSNYLSGSSYSVRMMTQIKNKFISIKNISDDDIKLIEECKRLFNSEQSKRMKGKNFYFSEKDKNKEILHINIKTIPEDEIIKRRLCSNRASRYIILDENGEKVYDGYFSLELLCKENNWDYKSLRQSLLRDGEPIDIYLNSIKPISNMGWRCMRYNNQDTIIKYRTPYKHFIGYKLFRYDEFIKDIYIKDDLEQILDEFNLGCTLMKKSIVRGRIPDFINESAKGYHLRSYVYDYNEIFNSSWEDKRDSYVIYLNDSIVLKYKGFHLNKELNKFPNLNNKNVRRSYINKVIIKTKCGLLKVVKNLDDNHKMEVKIKKIPQVKKTTKRYKLYLLRNEKCRTINFNSLTEAKDFINKAKHKYPGITRYGYIRESSAVSLRLFREKPTEIKKHTLLLCYLGKCKKEIIYGNILTYCRLKSLDKMYKSFYNNAIFSRGKYKGTKMITEIIKIEKDQI